MGCWLRAASLAWRCCFWRTHAANVQTLQQQLTNTHRIIERLTSENAALQQKLRTLAAIITELTHEADTGTTVVTLPPATTHTHIDTRITQTTNRR
jgi:predicted RNase H-like nuclease (RuvC/YqgF family)